ncbi:PREDICTED: uncharacterized protein LOC103341903 [Prunus mume]|uniref:Uncharacterized protein LOC103341903 n=1 Tax=Prunus mume TaxID=102107 RepID=A0ABM1LXF9_PRUMU|nr:PREDICTED: uncharacterized protein LOC103341903 [Prunus mume]
MILDGSLRFLDVCGIIKDALLQIKKDVNKAMNKAFKVKESYGTDKNHETPAVINMLKELDAVTVAVFESLLSFIAGSKSKSSSWSLVSKLVQPKRVSCEGLEANIQDIEEGLECLFRRLIKARVSLLNTFNH